MKLLNCYRILNFKKLDQEEFNPTLALLESFINTVLFSA